MSDRAIASAKEIFDKAEVLDLAFTGMIRPVEGDEKAIMFTLAGDCSDWIKLSLSQVDDIDFLHMVPCEGHAHPLVRITMKRPKSDDARSFSEIARIHHATARRELAVAIARPAAVGVQSPPGATDCYYDWKFKRWVCPGDVGPK